MQTHKNMTNLEVARLLRAVAAAYQVQKKKDPYSRFRIVAYNNAADAIEHATSEVKDLWDDGKLTEIPAVGPGIAKYLDELFKTGKVKHFEEMMQDLPQAMFELMEIPGIGPQRALKLTKELGITRAHGAIEKLRKAAEKGRIRELEGFGEQSEREILESTVAYKERVRRLLLPHATLIAEEVIAWMRQNKHVKRIDPLGSLRRKVSTVGDIDIAVATDDPKAVIEHFTHYPKKTKLVEAGEATSSILLAGGVKVDLMVQPKESYGALLQHFTGSKHHNVALRTLALKKKINLSEYGIKIKGKLKPIATEEEFYKTLGMDWVPPEIREDEGEIQASLAGKLPKLIELEDIRGDLHMHSNVPAETSHDIGRNTPEEMAEQAETLGYEYIALSEHNPQITLSREVVYRLIKEKKERIEKINSSLERKRGSLKFVFNALEIDIQPSGQLALPENLFELLDFTIVSVHSSLRGSKKEQTERILHALAHPKAKILGHPTGRKLNEREGIELDWPQIFEFCKRHGKWLEINSWPERLDLPDTLVREAIEHGVILVINTDSHAREHMLGMRYGVSVARRGWAQRRDIANTLSFKEFAESVDLK